MILGAPKTSLVAVYHSVSLSTCQSARPKIQHAPLPYESVTSRSGSPLLAMVLRYPFAASCGKFMPQANLQSHSNTSRECAR